MGLEFRTLLVKKIEFKHLEAKRVDLKSAKTNLFPKRAWS